MPIDTSIYQQQQPNLAMGLGDLVNRFTAQRQAEAERQNRLAQLAQAGELQNIQLQQARQQQADIAATRQAMAAAGGDISQAIPQLQQAGLYQQAAELEKQHRAMQQQNLEFAQKRHESLASVANDIAQSPQNWQDIVQNATKTGALTPDDAQLLAKTYTGMPPEQIGPHAMRGAIMAKDASSKIAEQLYPNRNPEKFVDEQGNAWMLGADKQPVPIINPATGKQMKALPPAAVQINTSNLAPDNIESNAQLIAQGKAPILTGKAALTGAGAATMKRAMEINPDLTGTTYGMAKSAETAFASGKQGSAVRSFNVSLSHLDTLSNLADALDNKDTRLVNQIGNAYALQTGNPAPTNFNAAKKIVADEIVKAIVGSGGGVTDREEAAKAIDAANSPAQLKGVISTYKDLMAGQLHGLKQQYISSGGAEESWNKKLSPATIKQLQDMEERQKTNPVAMGEYPADIQDFLKQYGKKQYGK